MTQPGVGLWQDRAGSPAREVLAVKLALARAAAWRGPARQVPSWVARVVQLAWSLQRARRDSAKAVSSLLARPAKSRGGPGDRGPVLRELPAPPGWAARQGKRVRQESLVRCPALARQAQPERPASLAAADAPTPSVGRTALISPPPPTIVALAIGRATAPIPIC
jgi:hypothetical protein